jgi:hypothetical protein
VFVDALSGRNPAFLDAAASRHRDGRLPANRSRAATHAYVARPVVAATGSAVVAWIWRADRTEAARP